MTLATRLSAFLLVGFSVALYGTAAIYFDRQVTERLEAALRSLAAAAEIENGRLEWEPQNRSIQLDGRDAAAPVSWRVTDELGSLIDGSSDAHGAGQAWAATPKASLYGDRPVIADSADGEWRVARVRITAAASTATPAVDGLNRNGSKTLWIEVAAPLGPTQVLLSRLVWLAVVLSMSLWLLAAALGRAICRRALRPLTAMAAAARDMRGDMLSRRLPEPNGHDECQDLARAFNELLSRVEEAFERQRQFTGNASHQFRTPLAAILGQIEVALRRERPADEYRRVLAALQRRAGELRQLVEALLFLARADGDALLPDLGPVDLAPWLRECLDRWTAHPRAGDFRLELKAKSCLARIHRPLADQLVDNLLENACKHSSPGTPIVVRLTENAAVLRLEIEDRGAGISAADLPHIFEPFYRSEQARSRGLSGAGLGLTVAQRIATALGGKLCVESQLGAGSRFEFLLPRCDPFSSPEPQPLTALQVD